MAYERRRGRVVRAAGLWCRKSPYRVSSRLGDWKTLSVNPAENGYLFRIREGQGSERRGMGSAFHQLCPRYSGTLTPTAPTAISIGVGRFRILGGPRGSQIPSRHMTS